MAIGTKIDVNNAELTAWLTNPSGPVARDMRARATKVMEAAKRLADMHGTGRIYTQFVRTRIAGAPPGTPGRLVFFGTRPPHQASAPGLPPAPETGFYRDSITVRMYGGSVAQVVATAPYSAYLELGTRYMAPRPCLKPALLMAGGTSHTR